MVARSEAAGTASIDVVSSAPYQPRLVRHVPERKVTSVTQKSAIAIRRMAMVDVQSAHAVVASAQVASLGVEDRGRLFLGKSIATNQRRQMLLVRARSVSAAIALLPFGSVLRAVVSYSPVLAFTARRFAKAAGHVVKAKVADRAAFTAAAAGFFHSISHSRIAGFRRAENML